MPSIRALRGQGLVLHWGADLIGSFPSQDDPLRPLEKLNVLDLLM